MVVIESRGATTRVSPLGFARPLVALWVSVCVRPLIRKCGSPALSARLATTVGTAHRQAGKHAGRQRPYKYTTYAASTQSTLDDGPHAVLTRVIRLFRPALGTGKGGSATAPPLAFNAVIHEAVTSTSLAARSGRAVPVRSMPVRRAAGGNSRARTKISARCRRRADGDRSKGRTRGVFLDAMQELQHPGAWRCTWPDGGLDNKRFWHRAQRMRERDVPLLWWWRILPRRRVPGSKLCCTRRGDK